MAGLIKDQMDPAQGAMPPQAAALPSPAPSPRQLQGEEMGQGEGPDPDTDPNYTAALKFAMQALYQGNAAEGVAKSLRNAQDPVDGLANAAYDITSIVEERTQGAVPDELFALLATKILQEVADIGEAAGMDYKPADIAMALKTMILRYLGEQGMDTTQLQQAMDQVDPEEFNRMAEGEEVPA